jgi:hypothetical protein
VFLDQPFVPYIYFEFPPISDLKRINPRKNNYVHYELTRGVHVTDNGCIFRNLFR